MAKSMGSGRALPGGTLPVAFTHGVSFPARFPARLNPPRSWPRPCRWSSPRPPPQTSPTPLTFLHSTSSPSPGLSPSRSSTQEAKASSAYDPAVDAACVTTSAADVTAIASDAAKVANSVTTAPAADAGGASAADASCVSGLAAIYAGQQTWTWKGHKVNYSVMGSSRGKGEDSSAVVLVHGFGASIGHWRKTMPLLASDGVCRVYALDLLGLGASAKPAGFPYSIEAWAELVDDFAAQVVEEHQVVFIGNSIGSLIVLAAAAGACSDKAGLAGRVRGVVLLNCAGGLNNKAIQDDWRIQLALPIFLFIDFLLSIPSIAQAIFDAIKSERNVKGALSSVYCNKEAVDEELVQLIMRPADDEGALGAFVSVLTGPPGPRPEVLIPKITCPMLILWGDKDPFTPLDGPVGNFFSALATSRPDTRLIQLKDVGHCPHDDREEQVHDALLPWLNGLFHYD